MRTDSTNLSSDAVSMCRSYIKDKYGQKYLPDNPIIYSSSDGAQEAHEAIRPTEINILPSDIKKIDPDGVRLYELIWRQFVACQMVKAEFMSTSLLVEAEGYELRARGRVVLFDGFIKVQPPISKKEEDNILPNYNVGDHLTLLSLDPKQHFTKPTARYSEAALVKELENLELVGHQLTPL